MTDFNEICKSISEGSFSDFKLVVAFISEGSASKKAEANFSLAEKFISSGNLNKDYIRFAKVCAERGWLISGFDEKYLDLYIRICIESSDFSGVKEAYKKTGLKYLKKSDLKNSIRYFNLWQNTYPHLLKKDDYSYDFEIMDALNEAIKSYVNNKYYSSEKSQKIKIAYLVHGVYNYSSILTKIIYNLAKNHDKSRFEISVFSTDNYFKVKLQSGSRFIEDFKVIGCPIVFPSKFLESPESVFDISEKIRDFKADILVAASGLADFEQYLLCALKPAPIVVGLLLGPPAQFCPPVLDYGITWSKHIAVDSPVETFITKPAIQYNRIQTECESDKIKVRHDMGFSSEDILIVSAGRALKFQNSDMILSVSEVLKEYDNAYFVIVGAKKTDIGGIDSVITPEMENKFYFIEWDLHYEKYLEMADIYVDTFPSGGGVTLLDAARYSLPIISFSDDFSNIFDQVDWNIAEELFENDSLIMIPRYDYELFEKSLKRLIEDKPFREFFSRKSFKGISVSDSDFRGITSEYEMIYSNLIMDCGNKIVISKSDMSLYDKLKYFLFYIFNSANFCKRNVVKVLNFMKLNK
ncbi:glycosyltransferase family 4 protein [Methanoplanus sp. FWC-SCC4]|uniref:Glycosyltransferase family 4 protein n=1 Tax=Methanochimaera problematica TaxID=2609417 RepID=A0AA97I388_9EURY|nr:hypothetical protein [Methanoplanus sp. FWC-SCC4]WOF15389.1 glycosyltransferase family 4 protein [Methanoplanus sp. FWC-SCC4]